MAAELGMEVAEFESQFVRRVGNRKSLLERSNGDCVFFDSSTHRCGLYRARPDQCRTWPFWESNLESPALWREICRACPGAGRGPLVPLEQIESQKAVVRV